MKINFNKMDGIIPVIIQDAVTNRVLMLGFMNEQALQKTRDEGRVTFFSRSRNQLWTKGETSGNFLIVSDVLLDCDQDTLLIKASPTGPVCHTGDATCFKEDNAADLSFLSELEEIIKDRKENMPADSYTTSLFSSGIKKIAQKVGEEATEVIIDAVAGADKEIKEETADLLYHLVVLLVAKDIGLDEIVKVLRERHS
jgi:phosphoribosyl-ATP pyrophosphohydrolase/phosphoribosyl-AMP cyclohydrolase